MILLDDLAAAVLARCRASSDFQAAFPGGLWLDRGPDIPAGDYVLMTWERAGEAEWFSDGSYLQDWTLRLVAYTTAGRADSGSQQAAQLALAKAINPHPTTWDALRDGSVNLCLPQGYDGKHEAQLREGKDVFAGAAQWKLTVEGDLTP